MIIKAENNLALNVPKTYLTNNESSGTNVLRWKNPNGFSASWAIQVGETGQEQTEVVLLGTATPSGTAGTLTANTLYEHPADTPIYAIKYNQVVFERSTAGTTGTATPMTNGTVTVQPDLLFTLFDDTSGSASYGYRSYFRNSVLNVTTTESSWTTSGGLNFYTLGRMRNRIKAKLWNANFVSDDDLDDWINEWQEKMRNAAISVNEDYALGTVDVAFGTAGLGTMTATDFRGGFTRLWVTYNGVDFYQATKQGINNFIPDQIFSTTHPYFYMQGESVFGINPPESGGTARITYPTINTLMSNDTDELPTSMKPYSKSFVDYSHAQALQKDGRKDEAQAKEASAYSELERFKTEISPRNKTGATYIELVENISGDDYLVFQ